MPMMTEDESSTPLSTDGSLQAANPLSSGEPQADVPGGSPVEIAGREENIEFEEGEQPEAGASDAAQSEANPASAIPTPSEAAAETDQAQDEDRRSDVEKQPYDFGRCTVQIAVQLLPDDGDSKGRPVLLGVRTHLDAPILRVLRVSELGELPSSITVLLDQLKSEMPAREQAAREHLEKEKEARRQNMAGIISKSPSWFQTRSGTQGTTRNT